MVISADNQLQGLQRIGRIVAQVLASMQAHAQAGMTTAELDHFGDQLLSDQGAISAPRLCYDFPGATCISVNHEAAHGVPGERVLQAGDVINIDVSAMLDDYFGDTGGSFVLQPDTSVQAALKQRLCNAAQRARDAGIASVRAGQRLNEIGRAIERSARVTGFRIVRNVCSHGVGATLHEDPVIRNYYDPLERVTLAEGQVITIEPFLSTNVSRVHELEDGWTLAGRPSSLFAQFEHSIVVTRGEPIVLTRV
jgi:methionyl aminopeptidase